MTDIAITTNCSQFFVNVGKVKTIDSYNVVNLPIAYKHAQETDKQTSHFSSF